MYFETLIDWTTALGYLSCICHCMITHIGLRTDFCLQEAMQTVRYSALQAARLWSGPASSLLSLHWVSCWPIVG